MKPRNFFAQEIPAGYPAEQYDAVQSARSQLGLGGVELESFAQLYRNKVSIGEPQYCNLEKGFQIEIGTRNDHQKCLHVLDGLLRDQRHSRSCGLARVVQFDDLEQWLAFSSRLSTVLWIGYEARHMQEIQRKDPSFFEFDN